MARFLFTVWPLAGHLHPHLSIAVALRKRGHEVAFYTGESRRALPESEGLTVFPFLRVDEDRVHAIIADVESRPPGAWHSAAPMRRTLREWMADTVPDQIDDLLPILDRWRPDVIVAETAMWGPIFVLGESSQVPVAIVSTLLGCIIPGPESPLAALGVPPPCGPLSRLLSRIGAVVADRLAIDLRQRMDAIRGANGLPPMGVSVNAFTARVPLYLIPSLPELDYDRRDLPPNVRYVGPCLWDEPIRGATQPWLDRIPTDQPWVHVTEGSLHGGNPIVLSAAAQGLAGRPIQVILTTGMHRDPASLDLGPPAPNIHVGQWADHGDLLPRCSALVTTGGAGTISVALRSGVPLVVVPTHWDKPINARRVEASGVGVRLSPRRCTPGRLRDAVERVLDDPSFRDNARRLSLRIERDHGPLRAARLIETLTNRGRSDFPAGDAIPEIEARPMRCRTAKECPPMIG